MANSKYEYVRNFERPDSLLPNTWIVIRLDGRSFHRFTAKHSFQKPNDPRALHLMNAAAAAVLRSIPEITLSYGVSDEFSFVLPPHSALFDRREAKLVSTVVSAFTGWYVFLWGRHMPDVELEAPPCFDGRAVCYPSVANLRDYLCWRQVDCHINNLYNTAFWALVLQGGLTNQQAEDELKGTFSADKNEILFSRFGINYNNEPEMYRKGSVVYRDYGVGKGSDGDSLKEGTLVGDTVGGSTAVPKEKSKSQEEREKKRAKKAGIVIEHVDIIGADFWNQRPWLLVKGN